MLITANVSRRKRKRVIDTLAAVLILENYLNHQNCQTRQPNGGSYMDNQQITIIDEQGNEQLYEILFTTLMSWYIGRIP